MSEPTECSARVRTYRACTPAERQIAIQQLAALECATRAELADVVTAADLEEDWRADGATAMSAFVRADTDEDLAQRLQCLSSAQIDALARQHRLHTKRDARQAHAQRGFRSRPDHDFGGRRYSGFLPDAEAAQVDAVLDRIADSYGPNVETGMWDPPDMRRADALVELATQRLAEDSDPETCMVVVHADAAVIDGARAGNGSIDGMQIPAESVLRHLCDARIECSVDAPDGTTVGIGRTNRTPPRGYDAASANETAASAGSLGATARSDRSTTSATGSETTASPTPGTSSVCAGTTTGLCMRAAGRSPATPTMSSPSPAPTDERSAPNPSHSETPPASAPNKPPRSRWGGRSRRQPSRQSPPGSRVGSTLRPPRRHRIGVRHRVRHRG